MSGGSLVREFTSSRVIRVGRVSRVDRVRVRVSVRFSGRYNVVQKKEKRKKKKKKPGQVNPRTNKRIPFIQCSF